MLDRCQSPSVPQLGLEPFDGLWQPGYYQVSGSMICETCDELLDVYHMAVELYTTAVRNCRGVLGSDLVLMLDKASKLRNSCQLAKDALDLHRRQEHMARR